MSRIRGFFSWLRFLWDAAITFNNKQGLSAWASLSYILPCITLLLLGKILLWILTCLLSQQSSILRFCHLCITPFKGKAKKLLFGRCFQCWHEDSAGLPDGVVRGQLASSLRLSATQAIACSDEGKPSKAYSLYSNQHLKSGQQLCSVRCFLLCPRNWSLSCLPVSLDSLNKA